MLKQSKDMSRVKRQAIDEGMKKVVLSRLFGENCASKDDTEEMYYVGYAHGEVTEVCFMNYGVAFERKSSNGLAWKWVNAIYNSLFETKDLDFLDDEDEKSVTKSFNEQYDGYFESNPKFGFFRPISKRKEDAA